ncbi:hypothetical protein ABG067_005933 [Albugo candida]
MKTHILAANMFTLVASSDGALLRKVDGGRKNAGTSQMKTSTKSDSINQVPDRSLVWGDDIPRPQPHYGHPPQSQPQYGYPVQPQPHWNDLSQLQPQYGDPQNYFDPNQPYNASNIYTIFNEPHSSGHPTSPHLYTLPQIGGGATAKLTVIHHPQPGAISETNEYEHSGKQQAQLLLGRPCPDSSHRPTDESCGESSRRHFDGSGRNTPRQHSNGSSQNTPPRAPAAYGKDSPSRPKKPDGPRPHSLPQNPDDPHSRPSDRTNNPPPQRPPPVETTKKPYLPGLNESHFQALFPNGPIEPFPPSDDSDDSDDSDG